VAKTKSLLNSSIIPSQYLLKILLTLIFLIHQHKANALAAYTTPKNIFERIKSTPEDKRIDLANNIYKTNFRRVDAAIVMANLDTLNAIAQGLNDKHLQCEVLAMRADYYSVNKGLNQLSTSYYQQAVNLAKANNMTVETGIYFHFLGRYFFVYKQYAPACRYYLQSQEQFRQAGFKNVPDIYYYLSQVADMYFALGDYDNAKINLEEALKYAPANSRDKVNIINTIGLIYRNYKQFPAAISRFNQALNLAIANKDSVWIGIATGNIGACYFLQGQYQKAIPYIKTDYTTSVKYGEEVNGAIALLRLIKINIDYKNFDEAGSLLNTVLLILTKTHEDVLGLWANYYDLKSQLCEKLGQDSQSIVYRKIYEQDKDSIAKRDDMAAVERVKLQWEIDKRTTQLNKLKADGNVQLIEIDATIAVLILLIVISVLVYNRQRIKSKKDKELMLAEKRMVDEELKHASAFLRRFTENLRQKNALIENFKEEIEKLSQQSTVKADAGHLEKLMQAHIMTDENWGEFKKLFSKVHPGFFVNLSKQHPHLSATDTRMLALIKLGLNNVEMANMLGITVEGIKKAKQRLRKKMDM